ncbi:hypothetical protein SPRG_19725 [Saprolegnia parasitica CBS 223.65]|uniref:BZIP domain-containing protein n=1 Tax=Saprolegnia parasitica (strain CBS 223.65) TaxID=695850 RepID=A0A067CH72_SAPPC|nr:hypothetical protein SPRG_19725 [Saprolegnia parasitica CBS 223.65]KDO29843.1 hypothetical protein SPRG_19725 [Saprolegnia parasitica CBS 223.65]|eukprot:XP_012199544.1 hypothetical protein SPRG_19725 [Saprolegnia parasitica CBS 223.65]
MHCSPMTKPTNSPVAVEAFDVDILYDEYLSPDTAVDFDFDFDFIAPVAKPVAKPTTSALLTNPATALLLQKPIKSLTREEKIARRRAQIAKSAQKHRLRIREEMESLQDELVALEAKLAAHQASDATTWKTKAANALEMRQVSEAMNASLRQSLSETTLCVHHWTTFMPNVHAVVGQDATLQHLV